MIMRPDIAYITNMLCQKMQKPTVGDFDRLKRALRYVKETINLRFFIHSNNSLKLYGFSDANWVGCIETRHPTTGFCTYLGSNIISWLVKKQTNVSQSSTEAEYRAFAKRASKITERGMNR